MSKSLIRKTQLHPDIADLVGQYGSGYFISSTGNQTISGIKTFNNTIIASNISGGLISGNNLNITGNIINITGNVINVTGSGINLNATKLINYVPEMVNVSSNFSISGNFNSDVILANSVTQITGTIVSGNPTGFNCSVIQIGAGNIRITGSGLGITINSFSNRFRTSGQFAQISLLHTGNNAYIMYGDAGV